MKEKKKVLIVAHHLTVGGAQKSMVNALKAIDYKKYDVTLYVRKNRLDILDQIDNRVSIIINEDHTHYYRNAKALYVLMLMKICEAFGLNEKKVQLHESLSNWISSRMMDYEFNHYLKDKHFDVAISYIQGYTADLVADRVLARKKYMFYHSSTDEAHEFHERILPKYDAVIAVGEDIRAALYQWYPQKIKKIVVLHNYVDYLEVRQKAQKATIKRPDGKWVLCSCGRLQSVKGMDLAIKAAEFLKDAGERFIWYFVGDGPERGKLESMIREYGLEENIIITGMQSNPYPWIKACDIYVQPSREESYGLSIVEAQILDKPVVSTNTVGGKLLIKEKVNGLLSEIDGAELAAAIVNLMHDSAIREKMQAYLSQIDYTEAYRAYQEKWNRLLEG